jgi:cobalt/nickel transport system permease protein
LSITEHYILDDYAQNNALRDQDSWLKLLLGLGAILVCISSPGPFAPLAIALTMTFITLFLARIPAGLYLSLLSIPFSFAIFSCIVILFISGGGTPLFSFSIAGVILTVTAGSANLALLLIARTLGGMCSLFFIALTIPMVEIFSVMHSLKLPKNFVDLSMLIYHFIFVLIGEAIAIHTAQMLKHGYSSFKNSINSFAMLSGMLFIRAMGKGEEMITAMDARCYDGKFVLPEEKHKPGVLAITLTLCVLAGFAAIAVLSATMTIF